MHLTTDTVPAVVTYHPTALPPSVRLNRVPDGAEPVARHCYFDSQIQRVFGIAKQLSGVVRDLADTVCPGRVTVVPSQNRAHVNGNDVAVAQPAIPRYAMHDLVVDGC